MPFQRRPLQGLSIERLSAPKPPTWLAVGYLPGAFRTQQVVQWVAAESRLIG
jgi:hypothetical protein